MERLNILSFCLAGSGTHYRSAYNTTARSAFFIQNWIFLRFDAVRVPSERSERALRLI